MRKTLKEARLRAGLSQKQLAEEIGCSRENYSGIENGRLDGSVKIWQKIRTTLSVDPVDLLVMISEGD